MSNSQCTADLSAGQSAEFYNAHSGAPIAGTTAATVRNLITPDAIVIGHQGKRYGLYLRETLEHFKATWPGRTYGTK
jgi:hypothetical protein